MIEALIYLVILILIIVAWIMSISLFIELGKSKGYSMENSGKLWFLGIFATPFVVGLYVAALPIRNQPKQDLYDNKPNENV